MLELFYSLWEQGSFMALFVILLVYTTKKSDDREQRYIKIIEDLTKGSGINDKENTIK